MNVSAVSSSNMSAIQRMQSQMFNRADKDKSGGLDKAEFADLAAMAPAGTGAGQQSDQIFGKLDSDHDGSLTSAEMEKGAQDAMKGFQSTLQTFALDGTRSKQASASMGSSSDSDLIKQLLSELQTTYSDASSSRDTSLSMLA